LGEDGADPFVSLCRTGLRLERGLGELIWELLTLGLGVPSFLSQPTRRLGDREHLGSGSGPSNHSERHALLRAAIVGPNPHETAFWG
jgi:hypothetical protein